MIAFYEPVYKIMTKTAVGNNDITYTSVKC